MKYMHTGGYSGLAPSLGYKTDSATLFCQFSPTPTPTIKPNPATMSSALLPRCLTRISDPSFAACKGRGGGGALILPMPPRHVSCRGVFCYSNQASSPWPAVDGLGFGGNFYELLGIRQDGSFDEIKRAFKKKALKYHPDVSPPDCTEQYTKHFIVLKKAYETLSDPVTRAIYDRYLGGLHFNEKMKEQLRCKVNWEDQLEELQMMSMKNHSKNLSWGARLRRKRDE